MKPDMTVKELNFWVFIGTTVVLAIIGIISTINFCIEHISIYYK